MPSDQKIPDPPRGGFRGLAGFEDWEAVVADVERQVNQLAQLPYQPGVRHQMLRMLQERRRVPEPEVWQAGPARPEGYAAAREQDGVQDSGADFVTQFDYLPVRVGYDTLFARGELLIAGVLAQACQASGIHPRAALAALLARGQPIPDFGQAVRILPGV